MMKKFNPMRIVRAAWEIVGLTVMVVALLWESRPNGPEKAVDAD